MAEPQVPQDTQPAGQGSSLQLVPALSSGLVIGVLEVAMAISFAALIFSGALAPFVPLGIGYALLGAAVGMIIIALFTSWPGFIGGNQDVPAAIMALMTVTIMGVMPEGVTAEEAFVTVAATIALTTFLTGVFFLATGYFRLGGLVRFLPYPVMGGFLAGTGWLLISGAVALMADLPAGTPLLPALLQGDVLVRWLPGVALALLLTLATSRFEHYAILPGLLLAALILFFGIAASRGVSLSSLSDGGWLLGPFAGEGLWQPLTPAVLGQVEWPVVLRQVAGIVSIVLVSTISILLNASGVELAVNSDIDFDKELRVAGLANILASLVTGLVGFHTLSFSILNYKIGANRRLTGVVAAAVCIAALLAGASVLGLFPKMIIGALLLYLGFAFLVEWVIEGWAKMPRVDYVIVVTILLVTAFVGFFEAVALGLLLAVILFVVGYSRVDVVRHELSGATYHSRVVRSREEALLLQEHGQRIALLQLQGFIFFGTADSLLRRLRQRVRDDRLPRLTAMVLDLEYVDGLDTTALVSFSVMKTLAQVNGFELVFCAANDRTRKQLQAGRLGDEEAVVVHFDTLEQGMAWCERRLLRHITGGAMPEGERAGAPSTVLAMQMAQILQTEKVIQTSGDGQALVETVSRYFQRLEVAAGTVFIRQGQPADTLYFLAAGQVTARLNLPDGGTVRLETVGSGWIVGEIGFFLGRERTADVLAEEPCILYSLSREALARMEEENPQAASLLRRLVATLLAERVAHLTGVVRALER